MKPELSKVTADILRGGNKSHRGTGAPSRREITKQREMEIAMRWLEARSKVRHTGEVDA